MDATLLARFFGATATWQGPCTVILDADASVQAGGQDAIGQGGLKVYAPRIVSGRVHADAVCFLDEHAVLLLVQQHKFRHQTGEEVIRQTVMVADAARVAAIEFPDTAPLAALGLTPPPPRTGFSSPIS